MIYYSTEEYPLERKTALSIGYDLHSIEDVLIGKQIPQLIRTGIHIFCEESVCQEAQIRARSSLAKNGIILLNGIGTIDLDYSGELCVLLMNVSSESDYYQIWKGNRIAQLVFVKQPNFAEGDFFELQKVSKEEIIKMHELRNSRYPTDIQRTGGFGSTDNNRRGS